MGLGTGFGIGFGCTTGFVGGGTGLGLGGAGFIMWIAIIFGFGLIVTGCDRWE